MIKKQFLVLQFLVLLCVGCFALSSLHAAKHDMDESYNPPATANFVDDAEAPSEPFTLWYRKPARKWETEALPIGNGRLTGMVFGGVNQERIQFNEETVWDGEYIDRHNPEALKALPKVQQDAFRGKEQRSRQIGWQRNDGAAQKDQILSNAWRPIA